MKYFRGYPCNPELYEWLVWYERMAIHLGFLQEQLDVTQLIGGYVQSGGTHARGWVFDIWNASWNMVWLARQMGCPATWRRTPAQGFVLHAHGVMDPTPAGNPAAYQTRAVKMGGPGKGEGYNGLGRNGMGGRDDGPRPLPGRTWQEGIAWAKQQIAAAEPEEITVKHYVRVDKFAPQGKRLLAPGESFYLHTSVDRRSQASNITHGIGPYSITTHTYAEGQTDDSLELTLIWQDTKAKPVRSSPHYVQRYVLDREGIIRANTEFKRAVDAGYAVIVRVVAPTSNKAPVNVTYLATDAYLFIPA